MATIEKTIDVGVPVSVAYDQWTQFEEFPQFMEGVLEVRQLDDSKVRWVVEVSGERKSDSGGKSSKNWRHQCARSEHF